MFAASKDGTRVPFFLTAKKGLSATARIPSMLYGYGGFSISLLPGYRSDVPAWLELGGIFVTVNLRGGAEYGEAWHKAGYLDSKQNVFDDFIAVAEHLVREKFTSPERLGMMGGSNGGLLVGAVMEQRPDLFAVAMPAVGVMDIFATTSSPAASCGRRIRLAIGSTSVRDIDQVLAAAQPEARHVLSSDSRDHGGSRRPSRAESLIQVHRRSPGSARM